jgi:enoyl-CoA hydratase/carnithine racemase
MNKSLEFAELVSSKSQIAISAALNSIFSFNKDSFNNGLKIESNQFFNAVNSNDFDEVLQPFGKKKTKF